MHDRQIEDRLRVVLRAEGDGLPVTITPEELDRRLALRRRERISRRAGLIAAGVGVVLIGSFMAATNGLFGIPTVGSGPSAGPTPSPASSQATHAATDDSVLGPFPDLSTPPATIFLDESSEATGPAGPGGPGEMIESIVGQVSPWARYIVSVACVGPSPILWSIGHGGQHDFVAESDVACDGTMTTQVIDLGTPNSPLDVVVRADRRTVWRIRVATDEASPAFVPPVLRMIETGNTGGSAAAAEAFGRCAALVDSSVPCGGEWFDLDVAIPVRVPPQSRLTFGLEDDWLIDEARITAVSRQLVADNVFAPEYSVALVDQGGRLMTVQVPLANGSWIVRVALNGSRDGVTFAAHYDFPLEID